MTTEEFLEIMADNASDFPEFERLTPKEKKNVADTNIITGPATAFRNSEGRLDGVGGVRIVGVGEAWMITPRRIQSHPDRGLRKQQFDDLIRDTQGEFKKICDGHNLWRVFAIGKLSTTFLQQLGFEQSEKTLVWSRTE